MPSVPSTRASETIQASPPAYDARSRRRHESRAARSTAYRQRQRAQRPGPAPCPSRRAGPSRRAAAGTAARARPSRGPPGTAMPSVASSRASTSPTQAARRSRTWPGLGRRTATGATRRPSGLRKPRGCAAGRAPCVSLRWTTWTTRTCDLVLPCRDEGPALRGLLPRVPAAYRVIVVDNGSSDDTADGRARPRRDGRHRDQARVRRGGPRRARGGHGRVRRVHGRRRLLRPRRPGPPARRRPQRARRPRRRPPPPVAARGLALARPRRQRAGRRLAAPPDRAARPRHRTDAGLPAARPCSPSASEDRAFGYPVELLQRAVAAGWRFTEHDVAYHPRAAGTRSKVSGSVIGTLRDRPRLRAGAAMTGPMNGRSPWRVVVAKAPVAGRVKTRLGAEVGMDVAAEAGGGRAARHPRAPARRRRRRPLPPRRSHGDLADAVAATV